MKRHGRRAEIVEEGLAEGPPSLSSAVRALVARREDPDLQVDPHIARTMSAVLWIGGALLAACMLALSPPTRAFGPAGWAVAGALLLGALVVAVLRLRRAPPGLGTLFGWSVVALLGIAVLEWLAGGRTTAIHYLYALPLLYAVSIQPRLRALLVFGLVCLFVWAPLLYAPADRQLPADIAGQLLLLVTLSVVGRILFTLVRAQRASLRFAREQAEEQARQDPLTRLGNRLGFEEALAVEVSRAQRQAVALSLVVGDIDDFKTVNDRLGHASGDECLRRVAAALTEASRAEDRCFRWGGDEFVVLLPETRGDEAKQVQQRLCEAASSVCVGPDGRRLRLTCATAELERGEAVADVIAKADASLLALKRTKRREEALADAPPAPAPAEGGR